MKRFLAFLPLMLMTWMLAAQDTTEVNVDFKQNQLKDGGLELIITGKVLKPGVLLYGLQKTPADAVFSQVHFDTSTAGILQGSLEQKGTVIEQVDSILGSKVQVIKDSVQWIQGLQLPPGDSAILKGVVTYMYQSGDQYLSFEKPFRIKIKAEQAATASRISTTPASTDDGKTKSLLWIFLTAFAGGLLALLTPCIYSMIPVTVSFFTKRSKTRQEGLKNAFLYSLCIIIIFTLFGFLLTLFLGPSALNDLATHWVANILFFLIFLVFGISFLGAFEISLPASWSTKADNRAGLGSFWGIFFMALTLVIISFSCTGPIIGPLLVIASKGSYYGPLIGMFGFSLALALPFALFAFFPSKLNMLGKAGGWLNAIKVCLGFLELALALKFLSNADLKMGWRILDREIFIVLWIVIFLLMGLYLLGKLKFRHDDDLPKNDFGQPFLSVTRLFFAIGSLSIMVYLIPGLWGAPLKGLSAFLPPMGTQDFNADDLPSGVNLESLISARKDTAHYNSAAPHPVKYAEVMKKYEPDVAVNNGLVSYFDYQEALAVARQQKKPLMLDFTGINCVNCRKMEGQVWSDPEVMKRLKNDFVIASLFVDMHVGVDIPEAEQYFSKDLNKQIITLGDLNTDIQVSKFGANTQPFYFFLDGAEQLLAPEGYPYDPSISKFIQRLDEVVAAYKKRNP